MKNRWLTVPRENGGYLALIFLLTTVVMPRPVLAASEIAQIAQKPEMETELVDAFATLKSQIAGQTELDAGQVEALKLTIDRGRDVFDGSDAIISAAFDLVAAYDDTMGPLWIAHGGVQPEGRAAGH